MNIRVSQYHLECGLLLPIQIFDNNVINTVMMEVLSPYCCKHRALYM